MAVRDDVFSLFPDAKDVRIHIPSGTVVVTFVWRDKYSKLSDKVSFSAELLSELVELLHFQNMEMEVSHSAGRPEFHGLFGHVWLGYGTLRFTGCRFDDGEN